MGCKIARKISLKNFKVEFDSTVLLPNLKANQTNYD